MSAAFLRRSLANAICVLILIPASDAIVWGQLSEAPEGAVGGLTAEFADAFDTDMAQYEEGVNEEDVAGIPLIEGVVESVTLYRDQALVTRRIELPEGEGVQEIRVGRLPDQVIADSVFAEGDEMTEVRSVRITRQPRSSSLRDDVAELERREGELNRMVEAINAKLETNKKALADIDRMTQFTFQASEADLQRGVLDANALTTLVEAAEMKREALSEVKLRLEHEMEDLEAEIEKLEEQFDLLVDDPSDAGHEARLTVEARGQDAVVRVSYLVAQCGWAPSYTVRADWKQGNLQLKYGARVRLMSGEGWPDVLLTLSTASPRINASGPVLVPFRVAATTAQVEGQLAQSAAVNAPPGKLGEAARGLRQRQAMTEQAYNAALPDVATELQRDQLLNELAGEMQGLELLADSKQIAGLAEDADDEVDSQTHVLANRVSLDSRREFQVVTIDESEFKAELYHVAMPLLSSFAYRQAEVVNDLDYGLLGGPANVYLDGRFVGQSMLATTAGGQRLTIGLGADQQVRTRRELREKRDELQGGNRRVHFDYRLVVANFKTTPVTVRLVDRIPMPENPQDVSIQIGKMSDPVSDDAVYRRVDQPYGILRWDLEVGPSSFAGQVRDVDYDFSVEFDRAKRLVLSDEPSSDGLGDAISRLKPANRVLNRRRVMGMGGMGGMGGGM